jgi:L-alanine-DL-glutamate epimerase-like enolase superfamily enzyme
VTDRLDRFEVLPVAVPLDHPYRDATRVETHSRDVLVRLGTSDGATGWGAGTPRRFPTGETQVGTVHVLEAILREVVLGRDAEDLDGLHAALDAAIPGHEAAKAAVDIAIHDLLGRRAGRSVAELLGGRRRESMPTLDILPIEPPEVMVRIALDLRDRLGTMAFKLKIDADVAAGVERVAAVRKALPDAMLVVDANGAWDIETALAAIEALAPYAVRVVEQPVPGHRIDDLAQVTRRSSTPIGADESVRPEFVERVIATRAADVLNIKITREGGFAPARAVAAAATLAGLDVVCGSVVQTGLVDAACAHFFASLESVAYNESGKAPGWHARDIVSGLRVEGGRVHVPTGPGLGVEVDEDAVRAFRPTD